MRAGEYISSWCPLHRGDDRLPEAAYSRPAMKTVRMQAGATKRMPIVM